MVTIVALALLATGMTPTHFVQPVTGDLMLFDVRGEAVCPTSARWRRVLNVVELLE